MNYVNMLYAIKFWIIALLIALLLICFLVFNGLTLVQIIDGKRKTRLLKSYGCERYLRDVPSVGDGAFYGWKTPDYKINIDERDVARMKYSTLKKILEDKSTI